MLPGQRRRPPDTFIPDFMRQTIDADAALTFAEVCPWRSGQSVNVLDDRLLIDDSDDCTDIPADNVTDNVTNTPAPPKAGSSDRH